MGSKNSSAVDPATLAKLPSFYKPIVSPGGEEIAFFYDEHGRNDLYLLDCDTGNYRRVTGGEVPRSARWHILWGQDGESVYYHRDEAGNEQNDIFAWHRGGKTECLVENDGQSILLDTSGDGRFLLYASDEKEQYNLYRYDLETSEQLQLTSYSQPVWDGIVGPEDEQIAYVTNESETLENREVYVMSKTGNHKRRLAIGTDGSESTVGAWFPDGERLLVADDAHDIRRIGIYDLTSDEVEWLSSGEAEETPKGVSPTGRYVVGTRCRRGATMPMVYDLKNGTCSELSLEDGVTSFPYENQSAFRTDTTLVFSHSTPDKRFDLYEYDLKTDEATVLLEAPYDGIDREAFVDAEFVTYESEDGLEIGGILYDPHDCSQPSTAQSVPAVVIVHGGPHARSTLSFDLYTQFLASQGYAVFQPNYRGSTGRGREFKQALLGDWGGMEQADIAAGGRWLMERDWIDEDRVAIFGRSFGGYSVYSQLTQYPTLWTVGIAAVGITDLHRLYDSNMPHYRHVLQEQMGDPEENYELWRNRSPIEHVDRMEQPISIIHGVNDPRCPVEQARIFRDALLERGWAEGQDFGYTELEEGHGSTDIDQKTRKLIHLQEALDRWL